MAAQNLQSAREFHNATECGPERFVFSFCLNEAGFIFFGGVGRDVRRRPAPDYYSDNPDRHEGGVAWQPEVYETAARLAEAENCDTLVDIGCGTASKLVPLHPRFRIIGVDYGSNLEYCRTTYPQGEWIEADLETVATLPIDEAPLQGSILICSDVIEHLIDPMALLQAIRGALGSCRYAVISTPDRNLSRGKQDQGPPGNPHHVREWALPELRELFCLSGMEPVYCGLTLTHNQSDDRSTILIVVRGTGGPLESELLPPPVPGWLYRWRVERRSLGIWLDSLRKRCFARTGQGAA